MPKLIDYAARFAFLREAAFTVVRDRGVGNLSRRALAAELGLSLASVRRILDPAAPLELLAAEEVAARRRAARWQCSVPRGKESDDPETTAIDLAQSLLPNPTQFAEEIVWLRLVLAAPHVTRRAACRANGDEVVESSGVVSHDSTHQQLSLRERREIADGCWKPDEPVDDGEVVEHRHDPLIQHVADHRDQQLATIRLIPDRLGLEGADREHQVEALLALLNGLVLEICLGHRDTAQARSVLVRHLVGLATRPR